MAPWAAPLLSTARKMTLLVTGGAGFIGSHLCEALIARGTAVRVLDDFSSGRRENLAAVLAHPACEVIAGDVRDGETVARALRGTQGAFHLAAQVAVSLSLEQPRASFEINAGGTLNLLEAARRSGVKRIVLASSAAVYGDDGALPLAESAPLAPRSPYALDKWYGEQIARLYQAEFGLETMVLRFFNVYGARQEPSSPYSGVISRFIGCLRRGAPPTIHGDGEQTRDFVHVEDVARACLAAMDAPYRGFRCYNVASGERISINGLFQRLCRLSGRPIAPRRGPPQPGEVRHSQADLAAIRAELGYTPRVALDEGLGRLLREMGAGGQ